MSITRRGFIGSAVVASLATTNLNASNSSEQETRKETHRGPASARSWFVRTMALSISKMGSRS